MKTIKLNKKMVKTYQDLLKAVGAIQGLRAYPSHVFVSPVDAAVLQRNMKTAFRKKYPEISKKSLEGAVGMEYLNLGPVTVKGIKPGFVLVDNHAIAANIRQDQEVSTEGNASAGNSGNVLIQSGTASVDNQEDLAALRHDFPQTKTLLEKFYGIFK